MQSHKNRSGEIEPGQEWAVDQFRPEDAEGVRDLFLSVYGESYPVRTYIDPERLIAENAAGRTISCVAKTPRGDIVGHLALYPSAPCTKMYESGAGLVHRHYRGGHGIFRMMMEHSLQVGARKFNLEAVFGESVCNHVFTQKMVEKAGGVTCAIEVDLMPASAYAREESASGRVASLYDYIVVNPSPQTVFLPAAYEKQLLYIYSGLNEKRTLRFLRDGSISDSVGKKSATTGPAQADGATRLQSDYFEFAQVSRIAVLEAGDDFMEHFGAEEQGFLDRGTVVLQVSLPLSRPWVESVVDLLRARGYFFCGALPRWLDSDAILMSRIMHRPGWEEIQLHSDRSRKIMEFARTDWERTQGQ
jgi:hypothetical protein